MGGRNQGGIRWPGRFHLLEKSHVAVSVERNSEVLVPRFKDFPFVDQKTAATTGAASGIGRAIAEVFCGRGRTSQNSGRPGE
jgi:hypothetical protein